MSMKIRLMGENEKISKENTKGQKDLICDYCFFRKKILVQKTGDESDCSQVQRRIEKYLT